MDDNNNTLWLSHENPTNLMYMTVVLTFAEKVSLGHLQQQIEQSLPLRFRQRPTRNTVGQWQWQIDPTFDLRAHLHRYALPQPGDIGVLRKVCSTLSSQPLSRTKPLWQVNLLENYGQGCAIVLRLHRALGSPTYLLTLLKRWFHVDQDVRSESVTPPFGHLRPETMTLEKLMLPVDGNAFKQPLRVAKRIAWSAPIPCPALDEVATKLNILLPDLLTQLYTSALRRYLQTEGVPIEADIRALWIVEEMFVSMMLPITQEVFVENGALTAEAAFTQIDAPADLSALFSTSISIVKAAFPSVNEVFLGGGIGRIPLNATFIHHQKNITLCLHTDAALITDPSLITAQFIDEWRVASGE